jgi:glutaminyl-peptide cyclotransferase
MRVRLIPLLAFALVTLACGDDETAEDDSPVTTTVAELAPDPTDSGLSDTDGPSIEPPSEPWPAALDDEHQDWTVRVVRRVPHDPAAFTQGLERRGSTIIESTGRRTQSTLRVFDLDTGEISTSIALDPTYFGEGLTFVGDELVQLTLDAGVALRYDAASLEPTGTYSYAGEGWGLCAGAEGLWMSNGTTELTRRDPADFAALETVTVRRNGEAVDELNELECIGSYVVANVWKSNDVLVIDPASGIVAATIDASSLAAEIGATDAQAVLNGIADLSDGTLLLGGKQWPTFFVVEVVTA